MKSRTKADLVDRIATSVRSKIDTQERDIYKSDIKLIIDTFIEESRRIVLDGNSLTLRGLMTISLEDRPSLVVFSNFRGKSAQHVIGPSKAVKITPSQSFKNAVREKYSHTVKREDDPPFPQLPTCNR
jgi:nucleoid DNA-binding protein